MRHFCLILFLITSLFLRANVGEEQTAKIISLGGTCHTAIALRDIGFRKESFPLDWVISTDHINFIKILNEDFYSFTDEKSFTQVDGVPARRNLYYALDFPHDFDQLMDKATEWVSFKEKYERRIERFRALRSYKGKVFFVRVIWTQPTENADGQFSENTKRAEDLRNALDQYFPELDYTLIIWSHSDLDIPILGPLERVIELRLPKAHAPFREEMEKILEGRHII